MGYYSGYQPGQGGEPSKHVIFGAIVCLLVVLGFAVHATISDVRTPKKEVLVVGTNTPFPPFEIRKGEKVIGFDMDLADRLAKATGRRLVVRDFTEFDALLPTLKTGELDIVISSVTIRDDRKEVVSFSDPYFKASQAVLARADSKVSYTGSTEDFSNVRLGYQKGTTSQFWIEKNLVDVPGLQLTPFGDTSFGLQLLQMGSLDAIIVDQPAAAVFAKEQQGLALRGVIDTGEEYGVVVAQGDPQKLLPAINQTIVKLKTTGEYDKLISNWFGGAPK